MKRFFPIAWMNEWEFIMRICDGAQSGRTIGISNGDAVRHWRDHSRFRRTAIWFLFISRQFSNAQWTHARINCRTVFIYRPKLLFCITKFTTDKSNSNQLNMFSPFPTRIRGGQAFQVYFIVESSQIPNLAAGHLETLGYKPCRQVVVVYYCLAIVCRQLGFSLLSKK